MPNTNLRKESDRIISCASRTTNCKTPVFEVVGRRIGVKKATVTTIHAYTSTQALVDGPDKRFRRGRAAAASLIPATTGAAVATTRALPQYRGRIDGVAIRVPVPVGSLSEQRSQLFHFKNTAILRYFLQLLDGCDWVRFQIPHLNCIVKHHPRCA
jgi:glyceraldehyde 3-phosphate dehydrogenase